MSYRLRSSPIARSLAASLLCLAAAIGGAPAAGAASDASTWFAWDGRLIRVAPAAGTRESGATVVEVPVGRPVFEIGGPLDDGRVLVSLGTPELHGGVVTRVGVDLAAVDADTGEARVIRTDVVRGYPSPDGRSVAVIDLNYRLRVVAADADPADAGTAIPIPGRVVLAAWSPDGARLCVTAYPDDWTPSRMANPDSPEEFFRIANSDLYLASADGAWVRRLTSEPGYDYGGVFRSDGAGILFISTRCGHHAFHLLELATGKSRQLTNRDGYRVPIARSDTISRLPSGAGFVYEAQEDRFRRSIRRIDLDDGRAVLLDHGRDPRVAADGRVVYLDESGGVRSREVAP